VSMASSIVWFLQVAREAGHLMPQLR